MSDQFYTEAVLRGARDIELANAIGSLFINFALLNSFINGAVALQQGLTLEQARALVLPLQPRPKIEMFQWYAEHHWTDADIVRAKDLCKRAREVADFRNHVAHDDMVLADKTDGGEVHLVSYSGKHRFDPKPRPLPAVDVAQAAIVALQLAQDFRAISHELAEGKIVRRAGPPRPKAPRRPSDGE